MLVEGFSAFKERIEESMRGEKSYMYFEICTTSHPNELRSIMKKSKYIDFFFKHKSNFLQQYVRENLDVLYEMINECDRNFKAIESFYEDEKIKRLENVSSVLKPTYNFIDNEIISYEITREPKPLLPKHLGVTSEKIKGSDLLEYLMNSQNNQFAKLNYSLVQSNYQDAYMLGLSEYPKYKMQLPFTYDYVDSSFDEIIKYYDIVCNYRYCIKDFSIYETISEIMLDEPKIKLEPISNDVLLSRLYNEVSDEIVPSEIETNYLKSNASRLYRQAINREEITDQPNYDSDYLGSLITHDNLIEPYYDANNVFKNILDCFSFYIRDIQFTHLDILKYILRVSKIETIKVFAKLIEKETSIALVHQASLHQDSLFDESLLRYFQALQMQTA
jgi:hypothetical protein